jgi:hypothetical protein
MAEGHKRAAAGGEKENTREASLRDPKQRH